MNALTSSMPLDFWRGDCTLFLGTYETRPLAEHNGLTWAELTEKLAPSSGVRELPDKSLVRYALPCALKIAPLVGKTLKAALHYGVPAVGKQRSGSHTTDAQWVIVEFDGILIEQLRKILLTVKTAGIAAIAWTTWSFGLTNKPGVRIRIAFPVDKPLDAQAYFKVWHGAQLRLFDSLADTSGASLCQQQATWATSPDRAHLARRWVVDGGVASTVALSSTAPNLAPKRNQANASRLQPTELTAQIKAAFGVIHSVPVAMVIHWAGMPVQVHDGAGRDRAILKLASKLNGVGLALEKIQDICMFYNDAALVPPLEPDQVADRVQRYADSNVIWPALFVMARDIGGTVIRNAAEAGDWKGTRPAWTYLVAHHRRHWDQLWSQIQPDHLTAHAEGDHI